MFVAINNVDMNINDVEKWIKTARDANGGVISPEDAMEVLSKTNHLGHIKKVLRNIYKNCTTPEKMAPYKEFILSCVDRREMSGEAMDILREMAKLCCCEDELETINKKPKLYNKTDCKLITVKSKEEFEALRGENLNVYFDADKVDLSECDLSGVKEIIFKDREQEKKFMEEAKNFNGKVIYADEDKKEKEDSSLFSRIKKRFASGGMGE